MKTRRINCVFWDKNGSGKGYFRFVLVITKTDKDYTLYTRYIKEYISFCLKVAYEN